MGRLRSHPLSPHHFTNTQLQKYTDTQIHGYKYIEMTKQEERQGSLESDPAGTILSLNIMYTKIHKYIELTMTTKEKQDKR